MLKIINRVIVVSAVVLIVALPAGHAAAQQTRARVASGAEEAELPEGQVSLGTVRLPTAVLGDGGRLEAGTYRLRLTAETARPAVVRQLEKLETVEGGRLSADLDQQEREPVLLHLPFATAQ